ncbi:MAG: adenylate/guanylate cyclase domain-containing protein [Candidatus Limnocylindrales bacterium]
MASGTLTFLFSDIEGSTRLLDELGSTTYTAVLERQAAILRAAFAGHGGREENTEGDSFFVLFDSAREAVKAAVDGQLALAAEAWPGGIEVQVRMGLHAGEATTSAAGLVGIDINRAARIAAAAHGGQIIVSDAVRTLIAPDLDASITLRGLGNHRLKDLREPQPLCQVVADGLRLEFPPLRSLDVRPNNLPTQLTSFVGRERELVEAGVLLAANRLVTLTGPGGTGKTRLSLQVAANAAEDFPDGIFFVALETVREPMLVPSRIASSIGLAVRGEAAEDVVLREWLDGKRVLLVLDNFEQVLAGGPMVADLLRDAPTTKALVTSRAALRVSGEQEYPVPGLPTPPDLAHLSSLELASLPFAERTIDAESLSAYESVRLFIARAMAVRPDFRVTNENAPSVAAIVARLQGMPLAIELAAARVKLFSPDALRLRLENQLALLSAGARDLPERQQTLRGAIAWSYDLLEPGYCRLLDRLSVFAGGIELAAAEAVCGPAAEAGMEVVDGLLTLTDQSLIRTVDTGGEPRFDILEPIHEYAAEQLAVRGEAAEIATRHSRWFVDLAERIAPDLGGDDQRALLDRLDLEHDNIRAVLDRALAADDLDTAARLAFAVWRYWQKRGHLFEARRRIDAIIAAPSAGADPRRLARMLEALGGIAWWQGDMAAMRPAYVEAVDLWRALGDKAELANALYNYSFVFAVPDSADAPRSAADMDGKGRQALVEAQALFRELGDERGEANVFWGMGNSDYFAGKADHGAGAFASALGLFRRVKDRTMEAWSLHMLGGSLLRLGRLDESRADFEEALLQFHGAGDASAVALVLNDIAHLALVEGHEARASRLWGASQNLVAATGAGLGDLNEIWLESEEGATVRALLTRPDFERHASEGSALSVDAAVAYALDRTAGVDADDASAALQELR